MSTSVTLSLPDNVYAHAALLATMAHLDVTTLLAETIAAALAGGASDSGAPPPMQHLSDADLRALLGATLPAEQDSRLSELLARRQAGTVADTERAEFTILLTLYQHGLLQKAAALHEAVRRGLVPPPAP